MRMLHAPASYAPPSPLSMFAGCLLGPRAYLAPRGAAVSLVGLGLWLWLSRQLSKTARKNRIKIWETLLP